MKNSLKSYLFDALSISILILTITGCGNINSENSRVTLTMPYLSSTNSSQNIFSAKSSDFNPSTINDINCFAVMVGAPESIMSRTSCEVTKTVASNVSGSSTTSSTVIGEKRVGIIRGLVPSGNSITLDVPSGSGRVFTLVGLHAATTDACLDFTNSDLNFDVISDPYIVGESAPTNLESGAEVTVPIKLAASGTAFTANSPKIGECYGPDAPGKNKVIPTKFILTKNSFPSMILKENSCNPIEIQYVDDAGRRGNLSANAYAYISYTTNSSASTINNNPPLVFYTDKACSSTINTTGQISFDKNNDSNSKQIYFNTLSNSGAANYSLYLTNISGLANSISGSSQTFLNLRNYTVGIKVLGASKVISGECYNMTGEYTYVSGTAYVAGSLRFKVDSPLLSTNIYFGKDCLSSNLIQKLSVSSTATSPLVPTGQFDFSVRAINTAYTATNFNLEPIITNSAAITYPIEMTGGLKNPAQLDLNMWNTFAPGTYCSDVFTVSIANEKGSLVPLSTSGTLQISVSSTATGIVVTNESCVTLPTTVTLSPGEYQKRFTLYPESVSSGAEADIIFTANVVHPITGVSTTVKRTQHIKFR